MGKTIAKTIGTRAKPRNRPSAPSSPNNPWDKPRKTALNTPRATPFDNLCLAPLLYLLLTLDTTPDTTPGNQKNDDNRRLLAEIVYFCACILNPEQDIAPLDMEQAVAAEEFDDYLLELARTNAPVDGCRYGKELFPEYLGDRRAMQTINGACLLFFLKDAFEERPNTAGLYSQFLLYLWGMLGEYKRDDLLDDKGFNTCFGSAMRTVNAMTSGTSRASDQTDPDASPVTGQNIQ